MRTIEIVKYAYMIVITIVAIYLYKEMSNMKDDLDEYNQKKSKERRTTVQFGDDRKTLRYGKDCDTCVWKLKKTCTLKDNNGNVSWDPRCKGNNANNGFICSFRDAKYDVECTDSKCKTHGKGSCNDANLQKMYKKWYVTNV
jgi:hypothetical protein